MNRLASALLLALTALGCGAAASPEARRAPSSSSSDIDTPPLEEPAVDHAPLPYTAAAIAAACAPGRSHVYAHVDATGRSLRRTTFIESDTGDAVFVSSEIDEAGAPVGEEETGRATWEELRQHARFPAAQTTVTEVSLDVPAGAFDAALYTVRGEDGSRTRAWFAPSLPGPPVQMIVEAPDGELRWSMTLAEFTDPRALD